MFEIYRRGVKHESLRTTGLLAAQKMYYMYITRSLVTERIVLQSMLLQKNGMIDMSCHEDIAT